MKLKRDLQEGPFLAYKTKAPNLSSKRTNWDHVVCIFEGEPKKFFFSLDHLAAYYFFSTTVGIASLLPNQGLPLELLI